MAKGKKKKDNKVQTYSLGEFLEMGGQGEVPIYKEISDGVTNKVINLSEVPSAPQSSYEITIKPKILKAGPPYPLLARNIPFECSIEQIQEFFGSNATNIEILFDDNERPKGAAIVTFDSLDSYKTALGKDGLKIGKRSIYLEQGKTLTSFNDQPLNTNKFGRGRYTLSNSEKREDISSYSNWRSNSADQNPIILGNRHDNRNNCAEVAKMDSNWRDSTIDQDDPRLSSYYRNRDTSRGSSPRNRNSHKKPFFSVDVSDNHRDIDLSILRTENKPAEVEFPSRREPRFGNSSNNYNSGSSKTQNRRLDISKLPTWLNTSFLDQKDP